MKSHSVFWDIVLTLITFGLWNIYVQWRQISDLNEIYGEEDRYSFIWMIIFTILTAGLYFAYYEYKVTVDINRKLHGEPKKLFSFFLAILAFLGLWFFVDGYQQAALNKYIKSTF